MIINKTLVVADIHLGITREFYEAGISIPSQVKKFANRINELKKKTKAKKLLILGDLKHKVPGISWQEQKEIPEFLSLLKFKEIIIVKGNHDGWIEKMVPKNIKVRKYITIDNYLFTHGHRKVKTKKNIVIGHNHPFIKFIDDFGNKYYEPVWLLGKIKNQIIIIMPSFNELAGATIVNEQPLLGPIAKKLKKNKTNVFLLDGTHIGNISNLKIK